MQQALFAIGQDMKQHTDDQMLTQGAFKGVIWLIIIAYVSKMIAAVMRTCKLCSYILNDMTDPARKQLRQVKLAVKLISSTVQCWTFCLWLTDYILGKTINKQVSQQPRLISCVQGTVGYFQNALPSRGLIVLQTCKSNSTASCFVRV